MDIMKIDELLEQEEYLFDNGQEKTDLYHTPSIDLLNELENEKEKLGFSQMTTELKTWRCRNSLNVLVIWLERWLCCWIDAICGLIGVITFCAYRPWWDFKFRIWSSKLMLKMNNSNVTDDLQETGEK